MSVRIAPQRSPVVYPFIFPLFPVLSLYAGNLMEMRLTVSVIVALLAGVALATAVFAVFLVSTRQPHKSGLATTILAVLFFSYGHVSERLARLRIASVSLGSGRILAPVFAVLALLCLTLVIRSRRGMGALTRVLNPTVAFLVLLPVVSIGMHAIAGTRASRVSLNTEFDDFGPITKGRPLPDVYYIILDGYPNSLVLRKAYGFDNTDFTARLSALGFEITPNARSNYASTFLSLASSLNGVYLDGEEAGARAGSDRTLAREMIQDSAILRLFRRWGYDVVNIPSGWGPTDNMRLASVQARRVHLDEFAVALLRTTGLKAVLGLVAGRDARQRVVTAFRGLGQAEEKATPRFTFAHLLVPHPPYLFDRWGNPTKTKDMRLDGEVWLRKNLFLGQLQFVNSEVLSAAERILANPSRESIIIFQGDHGTASLLSSPRGVSDSRDGAMLAERMGILSAVHVPDCCGADFGDLPQTPVNTFRYLLRLCFGAEIDLLDDRSYFSSYARPYDFTDVTSTIDEQYSK